MDFRRKLSWKYLFGLVLIVSFFLVNPSCSHKRARERKGTLVIGEISDFEALNPMGTTDAHARDVYNLLFLSLLDEQPDFLSFKPRLSLIHI